MRESGGLISRLGRLARGVLLAALVAAAGAVVCRQAVLAHLDEQIRLRVESLLASHYRDFTVHIEAARRVDGKGIEVRGFALRPRGRSSGENLVYVDELFLACRTDLRELLSGKLACRQLILRRMKVLATCDEHGRWNVASLLPVPDFGGSVPLIDIENSTVELRDVGRPGGGGWTLREIDVRLEAADAAGRGTTWQLAGSLLGDHFKRVRVQGQVDSQSFDWSVWGTLDALEMSPHMLGNVPADVARYLSLLTTLRARAHLNFRLSHRASDEDPWQFVVEGRLVEGQLDDPRLPLPLTELEADVYCDNRQLRIEQLSARSGPATLQMSGRCDNYLGESPRLEVAVQVQQLALDERLYAVLPEIGRLVWDDFRPTGVVDVNASFRSAGDRVEPDVRVLCRDITFAYHKFPYRLQQCNGVLHWLGDRIRVENLTAVAGGQTVHFAADFVDPGPEYTGWLTLDCAGPIPINDELIAAMTPEGQRFVRSLRPSGGVAVTRGHIERRSPTQEVTSRWELQVTDGSLQYARFPYAIEKIEGRIILEDGQWQFRDLRGYHGSNYILCDGQWTHAESSGGKLALTFRCWDVPLEDALRTAMATLHPTAEQLWSALRPRGAIDHAVITLEHDSQSDATHLDLTVEKWPPEQNLEGRTITVKPSWLPVRLDEVTGRVRFTNGRFQLENVSAMRDKSRVELAGHGHVLPDRRWEVTLTKVLADRVMCQQELIDALPVGIRPGMRQLGYAGPLSISGNVALQGGANLPLTGVWDMVVDVENGTLQNELKLQQLHGAVRLRGEKTAAGFQSRGELALDSFMWRDLQVTQVRGPFYLDGRQLILGSRAVTRTAADLPRQVTAQVLGGDMALDAHVLLDDDLRFALEWSLAAANLRDLARHMRNDRHDITGRVYSVVRMQGTKSGPHTWQGTGEVRLREADIYELPIMVQLLSFLSLRKPDTTAFTSSDIDFRIQGEQIQLDRIDFSGDAISLKGTGWMDLNRRLNVDFYTLVGRQEIQIPLLRTLLAEASRNILLIQVAGTVDEPVIKRKALPELDETLQRIFPEAIPRTTNPTLPWTRGGRR